MRKLLSILFLSGVFLLNSGFGAIENSTYVQTETTLNATPNVHKIGLNSTESKVILELPEEVDSQSISEKVGSIVITSITLMLKAVFNFMTSILN